MPSAAQLPRTFHLKVVRTREELAQRLEVVKGQVAKYEGQWREVKRELDSVLVLMRTDVLRRNIHDVQSVELLGRLRDLRETWVALKMGEFQLRQRLGEEMSREQMREMLGMLERL